MTDVDFAGNFVHSTLDGVNLSTATTQTYEKSYVEDDAKAGETLGSSTDDLTAAATGSGEAETTRLPRRRKRPLTRGLPPENNRGPGG